VVQRTTNPKLINKYSTGTSLCTFESCLLLHSPESLSHSLTKLSGKRQKKDLSFWVLISDRSSLDLIWSDRIKLSPTKADALPDSFRWIWLVREKLRWIRIAASQVRRGRSVSPFDIDFCTPFGCSISPSSFLDNGGETCHCNLNPGGWIGGYSEDHVDVWMVVRRYKEPSKLKASLQRA